jgi:hypothetical protein
MTRLVVEFRVEDEGAAEIITALNQFRPYTVERAELEAHLFMVLARVAWREADRLRAVERRIANRKPRKPRKQPDAR